MSTIHLVRRLDLAVGGAPWAFAQDNAEAIATYFAELQVALPQIWNGEMLMARDPRVEGDCFRADYFRTDFASYVAWRDWGFPDPSVFTCFGMGALRSSDGAFVLGEMASHTINRGRVYFPAGTPDPIDVVGNTLDMAAGVAREIEEEVGLAPADYAAAPEWSVIFAGQRIAMIRVLQSPLAGEALRGRLAATIAAQSDPELSAIHLVRGGADISAEMPPFVVTYLRHVFG